MVSKNDSILVSVSSGKDSSLLLYLFAKFKKRLKCNLVAIHVNLGIKNFSKKAEKTFVKLCNKLKVTYKIIKLSSYGFTVDDLEREKENFYGHTTCYLCSSIRKYLVNKFAIENNFKKVATGHTLDDFGKQILSFYLSGNLSALEKTYPKIKSVTKKFWLIKPLVFISEKEVLNYLKNASIPFLKARCPYSVKKKSKIYKVLKEVEKQNLLEQLVFNFLKNYRKLRKLSRPLKIGKCKICGMPSSLGICTFCRIKNFFEEKSREKERIENVNKSYQPNI